ncbi:MAG: hypothetical protein NTY77_08665 [Elusimicrobia bacterium]|nr:hypothetical protein [Elusimicrobiota bacterium]
MRPLTASTAVLFGAALLAAAGCSGVNSTLRYGADGQPEFFVECTGQPMSSCYRKALELCPQGYFLVENSQTPGGTKSGGLFGRTQHVGAETGNTMVVWKNQVAVRCKPAPAAGGPESPAKPQ